MTVISYQAAALRKRPPAGSGTTLPNRCISSIVNAAGSTNVQLLPELITELDIVYVTLSSDVDTYIRFGPGPVAAASVNDFLMVAGKEYEWPFTWQDNYFSYVRKSADGTLKRYRSS